MYSSLEESDKEFIQEEKEDPDQKRMRLAKEAIAKAKQNLQISGEEQESEEELSHSQHSGDQNKRISQFLQTQIYLKKKKIKKQHSDQIYSFYMKNNKSLPFTQLRGHKKPITNCQFDPITSDLYSVGKDGAILRFEKQQNYKRTVFCDSFPKNQQGHRKKLFALDVSFDGKYLVSGGQDKEIKIWCTKTKQLLKVLKGHTQAIHSLCFKNHSYEFYSASKDGQLKSWDADQKGGLESFFGHRS